MNFLHAHDHYISNVYAKHWRDPIKALRGVDYTKYALSTIIYKKRFSEKLSKFKTLSFCQKITFSASTFFMHIFNMPVTCMQNIKEIQYKL